MTARTLRRSLPWLFILPLLTSGYTGAYGTGIETLLFRQERPAPEHSERTSDEVQRRLDELLRVGFTFRNLGPFRAGAWVSDIAVPEGSDRERLYTFYVAARNGGVWKTTNNGTTFEPIFDAVGVSSIGALAIAPSDSRIVWVGTGDASNARSAYPGNGVYKSEDGGKTWMHMGLSETHHIARIVIHPTNPDIVYVAAMGHLYTPNPERGVFKTEDGGRTWQRVLFVNDRTGAIDLVMNRREPETLYAVTYECLRLPWRLLDGGPGSGVYKTTDGGRTWRRLEGGLPQGVIGRIGLDLYQRDPRILYAVLENRNVRPPTEEEARQDRARGSAPRPRLIGGEVYRTEDGGLTWRKMNSERDDVSRKNGVRVQSDPRRSEQSGSDFHHRSDVAHVRGRRTHMGGIAWSGRASSLPARVRRFPHSLD